MSMNKTWAISSWISFLISMGILAGALRLHEFHNCASFRLLSLSAMIFQYFTRRIVLRPFRAMIMLVRRLRMWRRVRGRAGNPFSSRFRGLVFLQVDETDN